MHAFIALVRKDLVLYFSNRRALLMSIAAPMINAAMITPALTRFASFCTPRINSFSSTPWMFKVS